MLTDAQILAREGKLTASRVGILMSGDEQKIYDLWRSFIDDNYAEPSLDDKWAVQLGTATETLNLDWYEQKTGREATRRGEVVLHPVDQWAAATLDGWDATIEGGPGPVECKHVNSRSIIDDVIARYQPQLHWQMYVTETAISVLSVIIGSDEPRRIVVKRDDAYMELLLSTARNFMGFVDRMEPPVVRALVITDVKPESPIPTREVDMDGNNQFAAAASDWLQNKAAADTFEKSKKSLKEVMQPDMKRAFGHGVQVCRALNGNLSIKENR